MRRKAFAGGLAPLGPRCRSLPIRPPSRPDGFVASVVCGLLLAGSATLTAAPAEAHGRDPGRVVLGAHDGWAAATTGTTGGAAAAPGDVRVVTKRSELAGLWRGGNWRKLCSQFATYACAGTNRNT